MPGERWCHLSYVTHISDVNKAISIKAKAKAECLQEKDKPPPV